MHANNAGIIGSGGICQSISLTTCMTYKWRTLNPIDFKLGTLIVADDPYSRSVGQGHLDCVAAEGH